MITATELRDLMTFQVAFTTLRKYIEQQVVSSALAGSTSCVIKKRAEAIREALNNNPLLHRPESCKQPVH